MIGEDQHSALTGEEHGNLGETLKGPETVTGFCKKDYTSQHLGGTGTANFTFFEEFVFGGGESCLLFYGLHGGFVGGI